MSYNSISVNRALGEYLISVSLREPELLKELREESERQPYGSMQIAAEQDQLMA